MPERLITRVKNIAVSQPRITCNFIYLCVIMAADGAGYFLEAFAHLETD